MERTFISLNFPNVVSITIAAALGWVFFSIIAIALKRAQAARGGG